MEATHLQGGEVVESLKTVPTEQAAYDDDSLIQSGNRQAVDIPAISGKETKLVVLLSFAVFCVFSSFMSIQSLQGSLNDEEGLGVISLGCLYAAAIVSSVLAPLAVKLIGVKRGIVISFVIHFVYTASNFYPSFGTLIPSSILLGATTGIIWACVYTYIAKCAYSVTARTGGSVYKTLSLYNGINTGLVNCCSISGSLLTSLVMYQGHYNDTQTDNSTRNCGINYCPDATSDLIADPDVKIVYILMGIFLAFVFLGIVTVLFFIEPIDSASTLKGISPKESVLSWLRLLGKSDIKYLIPLSCFTAISDQVIFAEVAPAFVSCAMGIRNLGYVLTAYGVFSSIAGFVCAKVAKLVKRFVQIGLVAVLYVCLHGWLLTWVPTPSDYLLLYVFSSLWGVASGTLLAQLLTVYGQLFENQLDSAFSFYQLLRSLAWTVTCAYSNQLCTRYKLCISLGVVATGLLLYLVAEYRHARRDRENGMKIRNHDSMDLDDKGV